MKDIAAKYALFFILAAVAASGQQFTVNLPGSLADAAAAVQPVKTHLLYSEGPVVDKNGNLFFSEQGSTQKPGTTIWKVTPEGISTAWRTGIDIPNGNDFNSNGNMVCCENTRIVEVDSMGAVLQTIVSGSSYGKTNDLSFTSDGGMFFTDNASHFWFRSRDGAITAYTLQNQGPNGIEYVEEKHKLYVNLLSQGKVVVYTVGANNTVDTASKKTFATVQMPDGLTIDEQYNVWVASNSVNGATAGSIVVYDSSGDSLGKIVMRQDNAPSGNASNCVFGGPDNKTLYITGDSGCFKIQLKVGGRVRPATSVVRNPCQIAFGTARRESSLQLILRGNLPPDGRSLQDARANDAMFCNLLGKQLRNSGRRRSGGTAPGMSSTIIVKLTDPRE